MAPRPTELLTLTREGLYCPPGDFHIDPVRPVPRALITHGHADHARAGHGAVLATPETLRIMAVRYGEDFCETRQEARLGESIRLGDVTVRFHRPATSSARLRSRSSGAAAGSSIRATTSAPATRPASASRWCPATCSSPRRPSACRSSATRSPRDEVRKLLDSVRLFPERTHIVGAYALGKAQRVMALLREEGFSDPIYLHGAMEKLTELYRREGIALGETIKVVAAERPKLGGRIVICPPSAIQDLWSRKFPDPVTSFASGWMQVRARARQKGSSCR